MIHFLLSYSYTTLLCRALQTPPPPPPQKKKKCSIISKQFLLNGWWLPTSKKKADLYLPKLRKHITKSTGKYRWIQFFGLHSPPVHPGSDSVSSSSFSTLISGFLSSSVIVLVWTISTKLFPLRSPVMFWAILKSRASRADDFLVTRPLKLERTCDWPGVEIKLTRYYFGYTHFSK